MMDESPPRPRGHGLEIHINLLIRVTPVPGPRRHRTRDVPQSPETESLPDPPSKSSPDRNDLPRREVHCIDSSVTTLKTETGVDVNHRQEGSPSSLSTPGPFVTKKVKGDWSFSFPFCGSNLSPGTGTWVNISRILSFAETLFVTRVRTQDVDPRFPRGPYGRRKPDVQQDQGESKIPLSGGPVVTVGSPVTLFDDDSPVLKPVVRVSDPRGSLRFTTTILRSEGIRLLLRDLTLFKCLGRLRIGLRPGKLLCFISVEEFPVVRRESSGEGTSVGVRSK